MGLSCRCLNLPLVLEPHYQKLTTKHFFNPLICSKNHKKINKKIDVLLETCLAEYRRESDKLSFCQIQPHYFFTSN
jgi:hypothetical protein